MELLGDNLGINEEIFNKCVKDAEEYRKKRPKEDVLINKNRIKKQVMKKVEKSHYM